MFWFKIKTYLQRIKIDGMLLSISAGVLIGWFLHGLFLSYQLNSSVHSLREHSPQYKFIEPLLASADSNLSRSFPDLEDALTLAIAKNIQDKNIITASVYYRDLKNSHWAGVNEDIKYAPASMFKVVTAFAFLKQALVKTDLLDKNITINFLNNKSQTYTIGQLIKFMLIDSDNSSKDILESLLKPEERNRIFTDLGLEPVDVNNGGDVISPKDYAILFRVLFNGNYLSPELSERTLSILADTTFKDGLVAGVPKDLTVSHKFGYRVFDEKNPDSPQELHDCGIIYYPNNPYLLCIMTKGTKFNDLKNTIKDLSKIVYDYNLVRHPSY